MNQLKTTTTTTATTTTTILPKGHPVFSCQRGPHGEKLHPTLRGGNSSSQESPVLPIPSYPALCREDTTSWNHGRPRTHKGLKTHWLPATHQRLGSIHVLLCKQIMHTQVLHRILANTSFAQPRRDTKADPIKSQLAELIVALQECFDALSDQQKPRRPNKDSTCTCVATFRHLKRKLAVGNIEETATRS